MNTNSLLAIMQRHWDAHRSNPNAIVWTEFDVNGACQLISNSNDQLLLNLAFYPSQDDELLCVFKNFKYYNLFHGDEVYTLEFGKLSDLALQITSELLQDVYGVKIDEDIPLLDFGKTDNRMTTLNSIIYKIVLGITDWTTEELQYQYNNTKLIEQELLKASCSGPDDTVISSAQISIVDYKALIKNSKHIRHIISKPSAVLLAMYYGKKYDGRVAIVVVENRTYDLGISLVGDGVFEEQYLRSGKIDDDLSEISIDILGNQDKIDSLLIVSNKRLSYIDIQKIESIFQMRAIEDPNLRDKLVRGAFLYSGMRVGIAKDALLLRKVSYPICCQAENKEHIDSFELIGKETIIPVRKSIEIPTCDVTKLYITEQRNDCVGQPIAILKMNDSIEVDASKINLEIDIDQNFNLSIKTTDLNSNDVCEIDI